MHQLFEVIDQNKEGYLVEWSKCMGIHINYRYVGKTIVGPC